MPSWELFDRQDEAYREAVLPATVKPRVAVEALSVFGWERYVGEKGAVIGMTTFGASGPGKDVLRAFGFTAETVTGAAKAQIARWAGNTGPD